MTRTFAAPPRTLYPPFDAHEMFYLPVDQTHSLYVEVSGNPQGVPVVFFHGGPGGGTDPAYRRFFDPKRYRIVLFDQRGAGRSTPHACLENNTTWDLVADAEKIRQHLGIDRWHVFGGSWGSTLSLAYAMTHPERVLSMTLRGIFLVRDSELHWFYQEGASWIYPDAWEHYVEPIDPASRHDMVNAYYEKLTCGNYDEEQKAARAWSIWEGTTCRLIPDMGVIAHSGHDRFARAIARIECHYFVNKGFFSEDGWLLKPENIEKIRHIPAVIVQGRYDVVCPMKSAWDLHRAWPEAKLVVVDDAGHASTEPGTIDGLVTATDEFANIKG